MYTVILFLLIRYHIIYFQTEVCTFMNIEGSLTAVWRHVQIPELLECKDKYTINFFTLYTSTVLKFPVEIVTVCSTK